MGSGDELGTGMLEQILGTSLDCHFGRASTCFYWLESAISGLFSILPQRPFGSDYHYLC